jgi:hypothetical protein
MERAKTKYLMSSLVLLMISALSLQVVPIKRANMKVRPPPFPQLCFLVFASIYTTPNKVLLNRSLDQHL